MNDKYSTIRDIPNETATRIITKYYRPFLLDEEWVCGEEVQYIYHRPDTVYYDKYKNFILRLSVYGVERAHYFDAPEQIISHVLTITTSGKKGQVEYIRDPQGKLLEIRHHGGSMYGVPDPQINKYDNEGKLIERIEGSLKTKASFPPRGNNKDYLVIYKKTNDNYQYTHNSITGLIEEGTEIYDSQTNLLQRKITKKYQYGVLQSEVDAAAFYDNNKRRVKEVSQTKEIIAPPYFQTPRDLTPEEHDEYIRKQYFSPPEYNNYSNTILWEYDEKGNLISMWVNDRETERYEYTYDHKDNWIKKMTFSRPSNGTNNTSLQPTLITMRDITYYE